jgi:hypothetical protein
MGESQLDSKSSACSHFNDSSLHEIDVSSHRTFPQLLPQIEELLQGDNLLDRVLHSQSDVSTPPSLWRIFQQPEMPLLDTVQQTSEFDPVPLVVCPDIVHDLEQTLEQNQSKIISLGRYVASTLADVAEIQGAAADLKLGSLAQESLSKELSDAAQQNAQEQCQFHAKARNLERNLIALQAAISNIASPY